MLSVPAFVASSRIWCTICGNVSCCWRFGFTLCSIKAAGEMQILEKDDRLHDRIELHDDNTSAYLVLVLLGALGAFCSEFPPVIDTARCYHAWWPWSCFEFSRIGGISFESSVTTMKMFHRNHRDSILWPRVSGSNCCQRGRLLFYEYNSNVVLIHQLFHRDPNKL